MRRVSRRPLQDISNLISVPETDTKYLVVRSPPEQPVPYEPIELIPAESVCQEDNENICDYEHEIYTHMCKEEMEYQPSQKYWEHQPYITADMRSMLIDWIQQIHSRLQMHTNTLYITVGLIDRFLTKRVIPVEHLQLLGSAALYMAVKAEESLRLPASKLVRYAGGCFSEENLKAMEQEIWQNVDFKIIVPNVCDFLVWYNQFLESDAIVAYLSYYISEFVLLISDMIGAVPSKLAVAILSLARALLGQLPALPESLATYSSTSLAEIEPCVHYLATRLRASSDNLSVKAKFDADDVEHVSRIPVPERITLL